MTTEPLGRTPTEEEARAELKAGIKLFFASGDIRADLPDEAIAAYREAVRASALREAREWKATDVRSPWTLEKYQRHQGYVPELREHFPVPPIPDVIRHNINWLIQSCYGPVEHGRQARPETPDGAINWGDLECLCVEPLGEGDDARWLATIDEAAPDNAELHAFIEGWLLKWGWRVEVQTEW